MSESSWRGHGGWDGRSSGDIENDGCWYILKVEWGIADRLKVGLGRKGGRGIL